MTPSTLTAIRSILGGHFSEARAKALYRVVLEEELAASRDRAPATGSALDGLHDKIAGLEADLFLAVSVAYRRGAVVWAQLNYPEWIERLADAASTSSAKPVAVKAPGMLSKLPEEEVG